MPSIGLGNFGFKLPSEFPQFDPTPMIANAQCLEFNVGRGSEWDAERFAKARAWIAAMRTINPGVQIKGVSLLYRDFFRPKTLDELNTYMEGAIAIAEKLPEVTDWVAINEIFYRFPARDLISVRELAIAVFDQLRSVTDARLWIRDLAPTNGMGLWDELLPVAAEVGADGIELQCRVDIGNPPHRPIKALSTNPKIAAALKSSRAFRAFKVTQLRAVIEQAQALGLSTGITECTVFVGPSPGKGQFGAQRRLYQSWADLAIATNSHISWWDWIDPAKKPTWFYRHIDYPGLWQSDGTPRHPEIMGRLA